MGTDSIIDGQVNYMDARCGQAVLDDALELSHLHIGRAVSLVRETLQ